MRSILLLLLIPAALLLIGVVIFRRSEPPTLTLVISGVEQRGVVGTHCWTRGCAAAAGPVTPGKPLVTTSPFNAALRLPSNQPESLTLRVIPVSLDNELEMTNTRKRMWSYLGKGITSYDLSREDSPALALDLEPGLYVFSVSAHWSKGSASIGFLVEVQSIEAG